MKKILIIAPLIFVLILIVGFINAKDETKGSLFSDYNHASMSEAESAEIVSYVRSLKEQMTYFDTLFVENILTKTSDIDDYIRQYIDTWEPIQVDHEGVEILLNAIYSHAHNAMYAKQVLTNPYQDIDNITQAFETLSKCYAFIDATIMHLSHEIGSDLTEYTLTNQNVIDAISRTGGCDTLEIESKSMYSGYIAWYIGTNAIMNEYNKLYAFAMLENVHNNTENIKTIKSMLLHLEKVAANCNPPIEVASRVRRSVKPFGERFDYVEKLEIVLEGKGSKQTKHTTEGQFQDIETVTYSGDIHKILSEKPYKELTYYTIVELFASNVFNPIIIRSSDNSSK